MDALLRATTMMMMRIHCRTQGPGRGRAGRAAETMEKVGCPCTLRKPGIVYAKTGKGAARHEHAAEFTSWFTSGPGRLRRRKRARFHRVRPDRQQGRHQENERASEVMATHALKATNRGDRTRGLFTPGNPWMDAVIYGASTRPSCIPSSAASTHTWCGGSKRPAAAAVRKRTGVEEDTRPDRPYSATGDGPRPLVVKG